MAVRGDGQSFLHRCKGMSRKEEREMGEEMCPDEGGKPPSRVAREKEQGRSAERPAPSVWTAAARVTSDEYGKATRKRTGR